MQKKYNRQNKAMSIKIMNGEEETANHTSPQVFLSSSIKTILKDGDASNKSNAEKCLKVTFSSCPDSQKVRSPMTKAQKLVKYDEMMKTVNGVREEINKFSLLKVLGIKSHVASSLYVCSPKQARKTIYSEDPGMKLLKNSNSECLLTKKEQHHALQKLGLIYQIQTFNSSPPPLFSTSIQNDISKMRNRLSLILKKSEKTNNFTSTMPTPSVSRTRLTSPSHLGPYALILPHISRRKKRGIHRKKNAPIRSSLAIMDKF